MKTESELQEELKELRNQIQLLSDEPFARNRRELIAYYTIQAEVLAEVLGEEPTISADALAEQLVKNRSNSLKFKDIHDRVSTCTLCQLHKSGTRCSRPGIGPLHVPVLVLLRQEPSKDQLEMLKTMMEHPDTVRISNRMYHITWSLKCRGETPGDFDETSSVEVCSEHTRDHVFLINPQVIFAMGRAANMQLTQMKAKSLDDVRETGYKYFHYDVVPSYGLEDIEATEGTEQKRIKSLIWQDLLKLREKIEREEHERQLGYKS